MLTKITSPINALSELEEIQNGRIVKASNLLTNRLINSDSLIIENGDIMSTKKEAIQIKDMIQVKTDETVVNPLVDTLTSLLSKFVTRVAVNTKGKRAVEIAVNKGKILKFELSNSPIRVIVYRDPNPKNSQGKHPRTAFIAAKMQIESDGHKYFMIGVDSKFLDSIKDAKNANILYNAFSKVALELLLITSTDEQGKTPKAQNGSVYGLLFKSWTEFFGANAEWNGTAKGYSVVTNAKSMNDQVASETQDTLISVFASHEEQAKTEDKPSNRAPRAPRNRFVGTAIKENDSKLANGKERTTRLVLEWCTDFTTTKTAAQVKASTPICACHKMPIRTIEVAEKDYKSPVTTRQMTEEELAHNAAVKAEEIGV